jgi:hypothetical protein
MLPQFFDARSENIVPVETAVRTATILLDPSWVGPFYVTSRLYVVIVSAHTYGNKAEIRPPDADALLFSWG